MPLKQTFRQDYFRKTEKTFPNGEKIIRHKHITRRIKIREGVEPNQTKLQVTTRGKIKLE